jgi:hypothetical protein
MLQHTGFLYPGVDIPLQRINKVTAYSPAYILKKGVALWTGKIVNWGQKI